MTFLVNVNRIFICKLIIMTLSRYSKKNINNIGQGKLRDCKIHNTADQTQFSIYIIQNNMFSTQLFESKMLKYSTP